MAKEKYPVVGFHFNVSFFGLPKAKELQVGFQSVEGLNMQSEFKLVKEGGENRFIHKLPTGIRYEPLILKKGFLTGENTALIPWCQESFKSNRKQPISGINITVLDEQHQPLLRWHVSHVWPLRWEIGKLNAEKSEILIETLVLHYSHLESIT